MKFFDADYSVTEFKINNKLIGYIPENFYPRHLDPLLEKMSKKPSLSENGCNSWGEPEYLPAQKKFLMYIVKRDKSSKKKLKLFRLFLLLLGVTP